MNNIDFIALDVETANASLWSVCQIGLAYFKDGEVVDTWSTLVNPETEFEKMNIRIHGITPDMVKKSITLPGLFELMERK